MFKNLIQPFIFLLTFFLLSSCIIYKGNNINKIDYKQTSSNSQKQKKIYISWDFDFLPIGTLNYEDRSRLFSRVLYESECCEVVSKKSEADIIFEGKAYDRRNPNRIYGFMISAATLYLVPSWHVAKIFVIADVKSKNKTNHYEVVDSITTAVWLPLVFASPFSGNFDSVEREVLENAYRSIIFKMKNDNFY